MVTDRSRKLLALAIYGVVLVMGAAGFLLKGRVTADDVFGIPFFAFATMGAIVAARQPRNPVGWIFIVVGLTPTTGFFTGAYAARSLAVPGGLPGGVVIEWVSSWAWFPGIGLLATFALLLFPDGKLPSPRWRLIPYVAATLIVIVTVSMAFLPGLMEPFDATLPSNLNPFGIESARSMLETLEGVSFSLVPLLSLICALSLGARYRRASYEQRQQIKWFAYSAVVLVLCIAFENPISVLLGEPVAEAFFFIGMIFPPVGAGVGILKYRLYDIDVVINRTLVYAILSALLAAAYLGLVVILQGALAGLGNDSDLAVAASTLAVAGLFRPLRSQVQAFIDHRFYRRKYDARMTLETFSARLRDDVDLGHLAADLTGVVAQTMQPAHASLWLREGARR